MKTYCNIIIFFIAIITCYSQNYNDIDTKQINVVDASLYIDYIKSDLKLKQDIRNKIFITQLGENNLSNIRVKAQSSQINVQQSGDNNEVLIDVYAKVVNENVIQIGSRNVFEDYNHLNTQLHKVDVFQKGTNQRIYMSGSNSISKDLKIKLIGHNKTIFINNF